ncbi:PIN domain-containing protein [Ottowia sp.]|jgi:predicted nucleic acid-binding protein|uniref:PIN domain-containing protein n=1 Tax=Ottowia sp. TaxID=1898956 RepID=UPI0025E76F8C|nr:PIN domain-containing protein [Ottowia sp.]MBK6614331.1 PIN domain-containing protein [Ottowia sp.]
MPSASTVFVDTNVLLYAQDPRNPDKQALAAAWLAWCWRAQAGRISSQVLHEWYVNLRRVAPRLPVAQARALVRRYRSWHPLMVDGATVDRAWAIQDETSYSYWDCLMLAAAQEQGCRYFLTEDLQHQRQLGALTVVNPFLGSPSDLNLPLP